MAGTDHTVPCRSLSREYAFYFKCIRKPLEIFQPHSNLHVKESLWLLCGKGTGRKARIGAWKADSVRKDASNIYSGVGSRDGKVGWGEKDRNKGGFSGF